MSDIDIEWFKSNPQQPDVLGLDYYPHSDWQLDSIAGGRVRQSRADNPHGLYGVATDYYNRYGLPAHADRDERRGSADQTARSGWTPRSTTSAGCARKASDAGDVLVANDRSG
jgi:hypothetical protein